MNLGIEGVGIVGGFGCGMADLRQALSRNPHPPEIMEVPMGESRIAMPIFRADASPLDRFVSKRATRRIDHFSKLALLGAYLALEDAERLEESRERMGVVIATGYGAVRTTFKFLDSVMDDGDVCASPTHFSNSVHNAAAAHVAIQLQATGPSLTVSQFEMSVPSALMTARQWLAEGRVDSVLFGAVDEAESVLGYSWDRFFGTPGAGIEPFALDRQTAIPAEGAAFLYLSRNGEGRYGRLTSVCQGRSGYSPISDSDTTYILGADGHRKCSAGYSDMIPDGAYVSAYTPYYGSLPVGMAFDMAIGSLALREGRMPGSAEGVLPANRWNRAEARPVSGPICCLKCDGHGSFGALVLESP